MKSFGNSIWFRLAIVLFAYAIVAPTVTVISQDTKTNSVPVKPPVRRHHLTGAELYSIHCNRCHPERYPTERTAAQWKTILMHMRVRANLPAEQARTILKYLQENSGR